MMASGQERGYPIAHSFEVLRHVASVLPSEYIHLAAGYTFLRFKEASPRCTIIADHVGMRIRRWFSEPERMPAAG